MQTQIRNDQGFQSKQQALGVNGVRITGTEVRTDNVTAVTAVANIVKSSLGPDGLDKMLVDDLGELSQTNDGATILRKMEIENPAGRILVDLARLQDEEIGDGTTSVVILAAELLKKAQKLIRQRIHPSNIINGYKIAMREAVKQINLRVGETVDAKNRPLLQQIARTSFSSKVISQLNLDLFTSIVVDSVLAVERINEFDGSVSYNRKSIGILKLQGMSLGDSSLVRGCVLQAMRTSQDMPLRVSSARIALLDFDLRAVKLRLGISATLTDPSKVESMQKREMDITRERVCKIIAAGANVLLTTGGMDDAIQKLLVEAGVIGARRISKNDMLRIAQATGAKVQTTLCDLEGDESFEPECLGHAESVSEQRIAEDSCLVIKGCEGRAATILLRGVSSLLIEEAERALNDALFSVTRSLEAGSIVGGGGAVETFLSTYLENFSRSIDKREQLAIDAFAQALLVIPKQLVINSGHDASALISKLKVMHAQNGKGCESIGLDLEKGDIHDVVAAGVVEPKNSKIKSIQFATEAAITILRIDDFVKLNPPPDQQDPRTMRH